MVKQRLKQPSKLGQKANDEQSVSDVEQVKRPYHRQFDPRSSDTPLQALVSCEESFYAQDVTSCDTQAEGKFSRVFVVQVTDFLLAVKNVENLIEILLRVQEHVQGYCTFESGTTTFFVFRCSHRYSVPKMELYFHHIVRYAFFQTPSVELFRIFQPQIIPKDVVKQFQFLSKNALSERGFWNDIRNYLVQTQGCICTFEWFPSEVKFMYFNPATQDTFEADGLDMHYRTSVDEPECLFKQRLSSLVKSYVVNYPFKSLMLHHGLSMFKTGTGKWLMQQGFISETGTLKDDPVSHSEFERFIQTLDPQVLAEECFDRNLDAIYDQAVNKMKPWFSALIDWGEKSPKVLVQRLRSQIVQTWELMIDETVTEFLYCVPEQFKVFCSTNWGVLRRLVSLAGVLTNGCTIPLLEMDWDTINTYGVMGFFLLSWANPSVQQEKMSLCIQGGPSSGKSALAGMLRSLFGFKIVTFDNTIFQNIEVQHSSGFVSCELTLSSSDITQMTKLRMWSDWAEPKDFSVKGQPSCTTKRMTPFIFTTNSDFHKYIRALYQSPRTTELAGPLARRFASTATFAKQTDLAYSNHQDVMKSLERSILSTCLTIAVVCFGEPFLENLVSYSHKGLASDSSQKFPLKDLFTSLVVNGSSSADLFTRAVCQGRNVVSVAFIKMIQQAVACANSQTSDVLTNVQLMNSQRTEMRTILNSAIGSFFLTSLLLPFSDDWSLVQVKFDVKGFAEPQGWYSLWNTKLCNKDPMSLVTHVRTGQAPSRHVGEFLQFLQTSYSSEQCNVAKEWLAYLCVLSHMKITGYPSFDKIQIAELKVPSEEYKFVKMSFEQSPGELLLSSIFNTHHQPVFGLRPNFEFEDLVSEQSIKIDTQKPFEGYEVQDLLSGYGDHVGKSYPEYIPRLESVVLPSMFRPQGQPFTFKKTSMYSNSAINGSSVYAPTKTLTERSFGATPDNPNVIVNLSDQSDIDVPNYNPILDRFAD